MTITTKQRKQYSQQHFITEKHFYLLFLSRRRAARFQHQTAGRVKTTKQDQITKNKNPF